MRRFVPGNQQYGERGEDDDDCDQLAGVALSRPLPPGFKCGGILLFCHVLTRFLVPWKEGDYPTVVPGMCKRRMRMETRMACLRVGGMLVILLLSLSPLVRADYLETIPVFWKTLYPNGGKGLYCGKNFKRFDRRYNIEHVFPMSWVTPRPALW